MSIYTRTGDLGETSLADGTRLSKAADRVTILGDLDELNSLLGLALNYTQTKESKLILPRVQSLLLSLGAQLSGSRRKTFVKVSRQDVRDLERAIDRLEKKLPRLNCFILPGGALPGALLHLVRARCRRLERDFVRGLTKRRFGKSPPLSFLNRLSDLLFVLARWENFVMGRPETVWRSTKRSRPVRSTRPSRFTP